MRWALENITRYVMQHNPQAAVSLKNRLVGEAERLASIPLGGRKGRVAGTREWVAHTNYLLVYRVLVDSVEILAVLHTRRNYP